MSGGGLGGFGVDWGVFWRRSEGIVAALPGKGCVGCFPELYERGTERCWGAWSTIGVCPLVP